MEIYKEIVNSELENMRMDRYLKKKCPNETMAKIYQALKKGDVKVNEKKIKENYRLQLNDIINIKYLNIIQNSKKIDKKIEIDIKKYKEMIIFENEDFFIVNKSGNVPMHKGTGHEYGLSEIYKKIYNNENINFANRLDYKTSGLVIGCKTMKFLRYISEKIRNNEVTKKYMTIVEGNIEKEKFTIENYLLITENNVKVVSPNIKNAKKSISNFTKIKDEKLKNKTLLEVELITGRKHQIRVQLSNLGHCIVGDEKYGTNKNKENKFYLCCYYLSFDNYKFEIESNF